MKKVIIVLAVLAALFVFIITDRDRGLWVLNTGIKTLSPNVVVTDIKYGTQSWQQLDVYPAHTPDQQPITDAPVMVFFHGGGWYHGRKDQYLFAANAFTRLGYTVVLPDYVKYPAPEAIFPAHLIDAAIAIKWVKDNIADHHGDPKNIFVSGHSAGAHTAALLATDLQYLQNEGLTHTDIRGVAPIAGPYRFIPDSVANKAVFGPESNYPAINPIAYINGDEPPIMVVHSDSDSSIPTRHFHELTAAVKAVNGALGTKLYEGLSHQDMVTHLHPWFAGDNTIAHDIDQFFRSLVVDSK